MPRRSIIDNNTWRGLVYDISNITYSTKTIFKISNTRAIKLPKHSFSAMLNSSVEEIVPLYLYDNIIFGLSNGKAALVIGERSAYCDDEILTNLLFGNLPHSLTTNIIGNEIANFIRLMLQGEYGKTLTRDDFITLCNYTSNFNLKVVNSEISKWICDEVENQIGLESFPTRYRNSNYLKWKYSYRVSAYKNNFEQDFCYSIGCLLEDVL